MSTRARAPHHALIALSLLPVVTACSHGAGMPPIDAAHVQALSNSAPVSFRILVPQQPAATAAARSASPATQSLSIAVGSQPPVSINLAPTSSGCTSISGATQCTIGVQAPPGNDTFTVSTYGGLNATGAKHSSATITQMIAGDTNATVPIALSGVAAAVALAVAGTPPPEGSAASLGISVMVRDANGNTIVGPDPYAAPIQLTDIDPSNATSLTTQTVTSPSTNVALHYTGAALSSSGTPARITATSASIPSSKITDAYAITAQDSWLTWGDSPARTGTNPRETTLAISNVGGLKQIWSRQLGGVVTAEPIVVGNVSGTAQGTVDVLYVGDAYANLTAVNAGTGTLLWRKTFRTEYINGHSTDPAQIDCFDQPGGIYGIGGSPVADATSHLVYLVDAMGLLYGLDLATGTQHTGPVQMWPYRSTDGFNITNDYGALNEDTLYGKIYVPSGAHCGNENFGGVQAYSISSGAIAHFFTEGGPATQPYTYGGVWGAGGTVIDPREPVASADNNVFIATGDGHTATGQYPCRVVRLSTGMTVAGASPESISQTTCAHDSDFGGSPVVIAPGSVGGCASGTALEIAENKTGTLFVYNADNLAAGPVQRIQIGTPNSGGINIGTPVYDVAKNELFINNASDSSVTATGIKHGLLSFTVVNCLLRFRWQRTVGANLNSDGPPAPPAVANGVVYYVDGPGSGCSAVLSPSGCSNPGPADFYAFNETNGAQLYHTTLQGPLFTQPVIVNGHVYITSWNGYGPGVIYAFGV